LRIHKPLPRGTGRPFRLYPRFLPPGKAVTRWEERIADIVIGRFPRSAAALQAEPPAEGSRLFRLSLEQLFPDFESSLPDEKESFLEAVESLERKGLVRISWARRRRQEVPKALAFPDPEAFFAFAGKPPPLGLAAEARLAALEAAKEGGPEESERSFHYRELFAYIAARLRPVDAMKGIDAQAVRDFAALAACLAKRRREGGGTSSGGMTTRALSIALYSDSKRLEEVSSLFAQFLKSAENAGLAVPDLALLDRSFPETMIAGKLRFFFTGKGSASAPPMVNADGAIVGFPLASARRLREIAPLVSPAADGKTAYPPSVLMIENKETFYVLAEKDELRFGRTYDALLYIGGHPNRAAGVMVSALAASGFVLYHSGDLDVEGILILQELAAIAGTTVTPVAMDAETFDRYRAHGRKLEASMLRRASLINEATRRLPGIAGLIRRIEATGLGVEQEIINSASGR
jgi:hypothetical protein